MNRMQRRLACFRRLCASVSQALAVAAVIVAASGEAGDDLVVDGATARPPTVLQGGRVILGGPGEVIVGPRGVVARQPEYDLGGLFDQHAFGRSAGHNQVFVVHGRGTVGTTEALDRALAVVRQRCMQRIETLEKVCVLDARQMWMLERALESDLKRVGSLIEAERVRYAGRTMPATPRGLDRDVLVEVRDHALRCRALLDAIPGPSSLLGGVVRDMLSPEQAAAFSAWIESRRACRWKAMVKTVLVQCDESGLGLVSSQATALETSLLADVPPLDVLRDGDVGNLDGRLPHFQTVLVTSRLARHKAQWEGLLDPRQRAMLAQRIDSYGDPAQVEAMLVEQGILEQRALPAHDQETD